MFTCFIIIMVKEKPNSIRIYDDEGFRRRAACICVRSDAETEVSVMILLFAYRECAADAVNGYCVA